MNSGVKLWERAKKIIAGGNSLLSKRPDMFLPEKWPSYFSKAKGIKVWDLDGNVYKDISIMGIGTNILGYGHPSVDKAVRRVIDKGNCSTLNCPEEVFLAEKLCALHPWAEMVRFSRTGGEACAMAVRIARAASGRDKIAFCGYHGWHDWYLAANLSDEKNLDGQLLPGLAPNGVPRGLKGTVLPFEYNKIEQLEKIVSENEIGVIMMEPVRNAEPENGFLNKIKEISTKKNIVLIFDEITSGFRRTLGGIHKHYHVEPDMAVLGKAMGNGYAISAIIGRKKIMEAVQTSFISSTFWTERTGPVAALESIRIMEKEDVPHRIEEQGKKINTGWKKLSEKHGLDLHIDGIPALTHFSFNKDNLEYKTFITQEMLKKGWLASNSVYACVKHDDKLIDRYLEDLDEVFANIKKAMSSRNIGKMLEGPVCSSGFKRLI